MPPSDLAVDLVGYVLAFALLVSFGWIFACLYKGRRERIYGIATRKD